VLRIFRDTGFNDNDGDTKYMIELVLDALLSDSHTSDAQCRWLVAQLAERHGIDTKQLYNSLVTFAGTNWQRFDLFKEQPNLSWFIIRIVDHILVYEIDISAFKP